MKFDEMYDAETGVYAVSGGSQHYGVVRNYQNLYGGTKNVILYGASSIKETSGKYRDHEVTKVDGVIRIDMGLKTVEEFDLPPSPPDPLSETYVYDTIAFEGKYRTWYQKWGKTCPSQP